jgi:hypothetical protein
MPTIVRTFTTRIDSHPVLTARAELESRIQRKLYAALRRGREFTGDLGKTFYQKFGISAKTLDGIHRQLKAKLKSISELAKTRTAELEIIIAAKRKRISADEKKLRKFMRDGEARPHLLRHALHQHKRHLAILERRHAVAKKRVDNPRICFGARKLFNAQHHLEANGFDDRADWLRTWQAARSAQFFIGGDARQLAGNQYARLVARDDTFDIELRLPETLGYLAEHETEPAGHVVRSTYFHGLHFEHGGAEIREALATKRPLSYRIRRESDGSWYLSVMLRQEFAEPTVVDFSNGCIGVDLNADHVALTLSERLPASGEGIPVLLASGDRVTLPRPVRIAGRHVWSSWGRLSSGLSAVHAGRRGARHWARSDGARDRAAATGTGLRRPFSGLG